MRTFFLQLFLTFWVATTGIFIVATVFFPNQGPGSPENLRAAASASAEKLAQYAVARFREQGCSGIADLGSHFVLATLEGRSLCGASLSEQERAVVMSANETGVSDGQLIGTSGIKLMK